MYRVYSHGAKVYIIAANPYQATQLPRSKSGKLPKCGVVKIPA